MILVSTRDSKPGHDHFLLSDLHFLREKVGNHTVGEVRERVDEFCDVFCDDKVLSGFVSLVLEDLHLQNTDLFTETTRKVELAVFR